MDSKKWFNQIKSHSLVGVLKKEIEKHSTPLVLWGTGAMGVSLYEDLSKNEIQIDAFCVSKEFFTEGLKLFDKQVLSVEQVLEKFDEVTILVAFSFYNSECREYLSSYKNVKKIYEFDYFRDYSINYEFVKKNLESFYKVYCALEDDESREVMTAYLNQRITKDSSFLKNIYNPDNQYFIDEINFGSKREILVDCGAFTGDTLSFFMEIIKDKPNGYEKVYCIEADDKNFTQLVRQASNYDNVECINKGVWDKSGVLKFNSLGTVGSNIDESGDTQITVDTIDNILNGKPATIIKMDIEGAELEALHGAENTIKKFKPRLAICVYHKNDDIITIYDYISKLNDYKFYMRAHMLISGDVVLYVV